MPFIVAVNAEYLRFLLKMIKFSEKLKPFASVMTIYTGKGNSLQVDLEEEGGGWLL